MGFSAFAFVCDLTGGVFSIGQNIVDKIDGSKVLKVCNVINIQLLILLIQ